MANFFDVLKSVIEVLPADKAGELIGSLKNDNETVGQVVALLNSVRDNPESASQVATTIISMRGIPGAVRDMVGRLPRAASSVAQDNGLALEMLITSIQSQMSQRRGWFG